MHPILFELGPLTLRAYGLMMALGFGFGIVLATALNRKDGRPDEIILDVTVWIMVGAIAGARLLYVAVQPEQFKNGPWWGPFAVWQGGLVYYGGLVGGTFAAYFWLKKNKLPVWSVADCLAPALALGQAFGRVGCFFNGCCYGPVDSAHGVVFPSIGDLLPHTPTQLYESAFCLALAGLLSWYKPRKAYDGSVFVLYLALYGVGRFILEFQRGDVERGVFISAALSPGQWISLGALAVALFFHLTHKPKVV